MNLDAQFTQTVSISAEFENLVELDAMLYPELRFDLEFSRRTQSESGVVALAGTTAGSTTATGSLGRRTALSGSASGGTTLSGTLGRRRALAGQTDGSTSTSGDLSVGGGVPLAGQTDGSSALTGTLGRRRGLSGVTVGGTFNLGLLTRRVGLQGSTSGGTTLSGDLTLDSAVALEGTTAGSTTLTGTLGRRRGLQGQTDGSTIALGNLSRRLGLGGSTAGSTVNTGNLTIAASGFVPSDIASFFDSWTTDISPSTDGGTVTNLAADSGTTSNDMDSSIVSVTRDNAGLDGEDTIDLGTAFSGIQTSSSIMGSIIDGTEWEFFIVCDVTAGSGSSGAASYFGNAFLVGESGTFMAVAVDSGGVVKHGFFESTGGDVGAEDTGFDLTTAGPTVINARRDGTVVGIRVNDRTEVTATTGASTTVGATPAALRVGNGLVGKVHIWAFDSALSTSDRSDMYTYLSNIYSSITIP